MTQAVVNTEHNVVNTVSTDANGDVVTDASGNQAGNIVAKTDSVIYASGTLDATLLNDSDVIPDFQDCDGVMLVISGIAGGALVSCKLDVSSDQSGVYTSKIGWRGINNTDNHLAAPVVDIAASSTYERTFATGGSALQIYVSTVGTGTIAYQIVGRGKAVGKKL